MLLTIDPGVSTGWALWDDALIGCGLGSPKGAAPKLVTEVWIEKPVVYPRSPVPPNDLIEVAIEVGRWAGFFDEWLGVTTKLVTPAEWKGQTPKPIHHARIWSALSPHEADIVAAACKGVAPSKRHNVLDAVGLGLWVRKRKWTP